MEDMNYLHKASKTLNFAS